MSRVELSPPIDITGLGVVSCAGRGVEALWKQTKIENSLLVDGLGRVPQGTLADLPAEIRDNHALGLCLLAIDEAVNQAGWADFGPGDGLILATTTGQFLQWDSAFIEFINGRMDQTDFRREFQYQPLGHLAHRIQAALQMDGPFSVVTSACTAATQAIALASLWLQSGRVRRCLVGGVEVLCSLTCEGFRSLQLLSSEPARPFDRARKGINLSEGAAFLCLENRATKPLARLAGFGFSTDAHHMTAPHPQGDGAYRAMTKALHRAGVKPGNVDWVHAHGTGSLHNDLAEGTALNRIFGTNGAPVTSTKWLHGHALGASGAIESALVVRAMLEGRILKTRGLESVDPEIPGLRHISCDEDRPLNFVLKNTLGFGGANAALVFTGVNA